MLCLFKSLTSVELYLMLLEISAHHNSTALCIKISPDMAFDFFFLTDLKYMLDIHI